MTTRDTTYPDADLVTGYIARRGVKTFHIAAGDSSGDTACGLNAADLIDAGWARGLRRRGLTLCRNCERGGADLDAPRAGEEEE